MCSSVNGTLPILRSKDQQDEIMSHLSSSFTPPTIMIMYVGLSASHNPHKVRNIISVRVQETCENLTQLFINLFPLLIIF